MVTDKAGTVDEEAIDDVDVDEVDEDKERGVLVARLDWLCTRCSNEAGVVTTNLD